MKFCVETLGCKVNQYETQALESILLSSGHTRAEPGDGCDVCVINTCAVTGESARKSRQAVRRLKKLEPDAVIAVCGCLSQLEPDKTVPLGADLVGGSGGRTEFVLELELLVRNRGIGKEKEPILGGKPIFNGEPAFSGRPIEDGPAKIVTDDPFERRLFEELPPGGAEGRTRAMLKIQDGCDNFCAYCIIPYARGHVRSLPPERVEEAARSLCTEGYREIVITGIEISSYGKDLKGSVFLADAVLAAAKTAPGARLRLGSLDPGAVDENFCRKLSAAQNLCNHFHLSLQSGCDETLRRMRRKYSTSDVREAISSLRSFFPDCGITADLITGFPGETGEEYEKTLEFIRNAAFSDMHIFPFSPRPGTAAFDMPDQVDKSIRRERAGTAAALAREMALSFRRSQVGKTVEVLFEREKDGFWTGHSGSYLEISVRNGGSRNSVHSVQIEDARNGLVWGEIIRP